MNCQQVQQRFSFMLDGQIVDQERRAVERHVAHCPTCARRRDEYQTNRTHLKAIPARRMPLRLEWQLRALASREASRRRRFGDVAGWWQEACVSVRLSVGDLMRPLAVPAMGGVFSAILLFALVLTNFRGIVRAHPNDVPTVLGTHAELLSSPPLNVDSEYVVVDVLVDETGRVIDYRFPVGWGSLENPESRKRLEQALRFSTFLPATNFGKPVQGWVRVSYSTQRSEMDVKG